MSRSRRHTGLLAQRPDENKSFSTEIYHVLQEDGNQHSAHLPRESGGLASAQADQTTGPNHEPASCAGNDNVQGTPGTLVNEHIGPVNRCHHQAQLPHEGPEAAIPRIPGGQQEHGHQTGHGADHNGGHEKAHPETPRIVLARERPAQVSLHQISPRRQQDRDNSLPHAGGLPHPSRDGNVVNPTPPLPQLNVAS